MKKTFYILYLSFLSSVILFNPVFSQDIPADIKEQLQGYTVKIEQYKKENNAQLELEFLNKAAFLCWDNQLFTNAIDHFKRGLELNEKSSNQNGIMLTANYIGMIYNDIQDHNSAISYFKKGLEINRKTNNKEDISSSLVNISQSFQQLANYEESNKWALEGVDVAKEINNMKLIRSLYGILANNYQSLGDSEKSMEYFDLFASFDKYLKKEEIKDIKQQSESEVNKAKQEKEQTKNELDKQTDKLKETESSLAQVEEVTREQQMQLELQLSKIREQAAQLKFEKLVRRVIIGILLIILVFVAVLMFLYRKITNQKNQIEEQRDTLDLQHQKINSSIQYAQNIQSAILPADHQIGTLFENFIIYRPKDIVSGDFYWFAHTNHTAFLAAVDCTGHGVPGAFMSMIGNTLLNEIVLEKKVIEPAKILSLLNEKIVESLRQTETENKDGMDVCFISIDLKSNKISFSGAKRPLYIYRKKTSEFVEIKGDRISIGGVKSNKEIEQFKNHIINAESGDVLFLSSDGLTDQNNSERKRFGSNRLKDLISTNISEPMEKQKKIIEKELNNFQQDEEQRDDITLIGIKMN